MTTKGTHTHKDKGTLSHRHKPVHDKGTTRETQDIRHNLTQRHKADAPNHRERQKTKTHDSTETNGHKIVRTHRQDRGERDRDRMTERHKCKTGTQRQRNRQKANAHT